MSKIERPDIYQKVKVFSTKVKEPNKTYWKELVRRIKFDYGTGRDAVSF